MFKLMRQYRAKITLAVIGLMIILAFSVVVFGNSLPRLEQIILMTVLWLIVIMYSLVDSVISAVKKAG